VTELHDSDDQRHKMGQRLDQTEGRPALEALCDVYTRRLHRQSNDFAATYGLRLATAKLQRIPYGPPVVTTSS
jgi:hypothetical protein